MYGYIFPPARAARSHPRLRRRRATRIPRRRRRRERVTFSLEQLAHAGLVASVRLYLLARSCARNFLQRGDTKKSEAARLRKWCFGWWRCDGGIEVGFFSIRYIELDCFCITCVCVCVCGRIGFAFVNERAWDIVCWENRVTRRTSGY